MAKITENQKKTNDSDKLGLEEIVRITNQVGLDYVDAKKEAERLELMKSTTRARLMIKYDDGKTSDVKLKRLSDIDPEYIEFLEQLSHARRECDRLKVRYESYKNLFDARRSLLSYKKAEMSIL